MRDAPQLMAAVLLSPAEALVATAAGVLAGYAYHLAHGRQNGTDLMFNTAQAVLSTGAAAIVYQFVHALLEGPAAEPIALLAAAVSMLAANTILVAVAIVLAGQGKGIARTVLQMLRQDPLLYAALLVTGILGTLLVREQAVWAVPLLLIPLILMEQSAARHVEEAERERKFAVMEEVNALRNDFIAAVTHDLRTPLTVIKGYGELLAERDDELLDDERKAVAGINLNAERLGELIEMLLQLSELDAGMVRLDRRPSDVSALIRSVLEQLRFLAESKSTMLTFKADSELPPFELDPRRFEQVLTNVIGNAIKFTPAGGEVTVCAGVRDTALLVEVADTGPGIDPKILPQIFERFYRTAGSDGGRRRTGGLGLAIAKSIVELHGGTITASSAPQQGSVFTIDLPRPDSRDEQYKVASEADAVLEQHEASARPLPSQR